MRFNAIVLALFLEYLLTATEAQHRDGDIRLVGGSYQWEGRVEIYLSGTWGTITDSQWTSDDAQAVCRKMGYFRPGAIQHTSGYFGEGSGPIHLDYVVCTGMEYNLMDCQIGSGTRDSSHSDDVGVKCNTINISYCNGDIRLVGGPYNWEGRVEILWSGTWSAISDTTWRIQEAQVVCRQLGLPTEGAAGVCCAQYGQGSGQVLITSVSYSGDEKNITECFYSTITTLGHQSDVGVRCRQGGDYREGEIRLVGGSYQWEGRVEIYLYGEWGTITDDGAGNFDARVVCRQLGYDTRGKSDRGLFAAYFGEGIGVIHLNGLRCSGHEYRLVNCPSRPSTWAHNEDWSVTCENDTPDHGEVRLFYSENSFNYYRGLVEVWLAGGWGRVNEDAWTIEDGEVVCRQLGLDSVESLSSYYNYDPYDYYYYYWDYYNYDYDNSITGPIHMSNVRCLGTESRLIDCPHSVGGSGDLATLSCSNDNRCVSGDTRLTGGETDMEGRVEVCNSQSRWGTVCNRQWTQAHTVVVCRSAGFSDTDGSITKFDGVILPIAMDFVSCSGSELRLWDCIHFTHSYGLCSHSDDAGIRCQPAQCVDGDMKLFVGQDETYGTVLVCSNKRWGTICDDGNRVANGKTVCQQLGYASGGGPLTYRAQSYSMPVHIERLLCSGEESRILDCLHVVGNSSSVCTHDLFAACIPADCIDGQVRLAEGGLTDMQGRLEVCFSGRWGTVSDDGWTHTNAEIVCNELGYDLSEIDYSARPATNSMPIFMENVQCSGRELSFLDCSYNRDASNNQHSRDVGVQCKMSVCIDGELRLRGSGSEYEGLLEVCFNQRWGTVNGDGWSASDTRVACRQLGFDADGQHSTMVVNNVRSAPIHIDNVACYESEDKLIDCVYHTDTSEDTHAGDIRIDCSSTDPSAGHSSFHTHTDGGGIDTAVIVAVVAAVIGLIALVVVIAYIICKKQNKIQRRLLFFHGKGHTTGAEGKSLEESSSHEHQYKSPESSAKPSAYEPLTMHTMQKNTGYESYTRGQGHDEYKLPPYMKGNDDEQIYETCA